TLDDLLAFLDAQKETTWKDAMMIQDESPDNGWLYVFHAIDYGWLLSCNGKSDIVEYFLKWRDQPLGQKVEITKAGMREEFREGHFVSWEDARSAFCHYFHTLERDPQGEWIRIGEADLS